MSIITADGRDITKEEMRVVPGFSKYKVTRDGDVVNIDRRIVLNETAMMTGSGERYYYHLYNDAGKKTTASFQKLIDLAYPELAAPKKKPKMAGEYKSYHVCESWHGIDLYTSYQICPHGRVRLKSSREALKIRKNEADQEFVYLRNSEGRAAFIVSDLVEAIWGSDEWIDVTGYRNYEFSKDGRVRNKKNCIELKRDQDGFFRLYEKRTRSYWRPEMVKEEA